MRKILIVSKKPLAKLNKAIKNVASLALVLWLSGATCVFGSCERVAAKHDKAAQNVGLMQANHSCSKGAKNKKEVRTIQDVLLLKESSSCPFTRQPTEQARKLTTQTKPSLIVISYSLFEQTNKESQTFVSNRARLPDRGGTHIKNCVFLI